MRWPSRSCPNLILMDVQLPKMSGLDATRVILKADPRTSHIPIIVITSFALSGDREKAAEAGADSYLAKPYSPRELLALVRQYLPGARLNPRRIESEVTR